MPVVVSTYAFLLNAAADPTDAVQLEGKLTDQPDSGGSVRTYGGGRVRWVQNQATTRKLPLTLDSVTPAQLAWLESHRGQLCLLRDPFGRRQWGVYGSYTAAPYEAGAGGFHTVTGLTFNAVTRFESV